LNRVTDEIAQQEDNKKQCADALKQEFLGYNDKKKMLNQTMQQ